MKNIICGALTFLLVACGADSTNNVSDDDQQAIWSDVSQRIVIVQDNGNVPDPNERYITYDFSLDSLSTENKNMLQSFTPIASPLSCVEDGVTYELTITDETGINTVYISNNKACNDIEGLLFIKLEDITLLISQLPS
tara:strand:- start:399 stop:812 length:414 start_codon:yes stop_codon:yes gene_type:complete